MPFRAWVVWFVLFQTEECQGILSIQEAVNKSRILR